MNLVMVILISTGSTYASIGLGLAILSIVATSLSYIGFILVPLIYAWFWDPLTFDGQDEISIFKMLYLRVLSLVINVGASAGTLNYAINV